MAPKNHQQASPINYKPPTSGEETTTSQDPTITNFVPRTNTQPNLEKPNPVEGCKVDLGQLLKPSALSNEAPCRTEMPQNLSLFNSPSPFTPQGSAYITPNPYSKEAHFSQDPNIINKVGESLVQAFIKELHNRPEISTLRSDPTNQLILTPEPSSIQGTFGTLNHFELNPTTDYAYNSSYSPMTYAPAQAQHQGRVHRRLILPKTRPILTPNMNSYPQHLRQSNLNSRAQEINRIPQAPTQSNSACFIPWRGRVLEPTYNQIRKFGGNLNLIMEHVGARDPTPREHNYRQIRIYFANQLLTPTAKELLEAHGDLRALMSMFPNRVSSISGSSKMGDSRRPSFRI